FGDGVKTDMHVSWKGGSSWKKVLADMLQPQSLAFQVQANTLMISRLNAEPERDKTFAEKADELVAQNVDTTPVNLAALFPKKESVKKQNKADAIPMDMVTVTTVSPLPPVSPVADPPVAMTKKPIAPEDTMPYAWQAQEGQTLKEI